MKITMCELPQDWTSDPGVETALKAHLLENQSELLLLPEMGFHPWLAASKSPNIAQWEAAVGAHLTWIDRLGEWPVPMVAGTRPVLKDGVPLNMAWIWTREDGLMDIHEKYYLPDEEGFWEASWYRMGNGLFNLVEINGLKLGFLICTELWFTDRAREYAREGIDILLCPRATPDTSIGVWAAGGQVAAWVSGAYCISSNFNGPIKPGMAFGGTGWVTEPDRGEFLGKTSMETPFVTLDIDTRLPARAKAGYPRYVKE